MNLDDADSVKAYNEAMLQDFIQGSLLAADTATKKEAIDRAILCYEQVIQYDSTNLNVLFQFAQFLEAYDVSDKIINVLNQSYAVLTQEYDIKYVNLFTKFVEEKSITTTDYGQ